MLKGLKPLIFFLFVGVIFFYSCTKDKGALPRANTGSLCVSKGKVVIMVGAGAGGNTFSPSSVEAKVGDTIVWRWQTGYHSVTAISVPSGAFTFDKDGVQSSSDSLMYILQIDGTYNYQCIYHSGMTGTINVCK